jgi:hypothetical protein
MATVNFEVQGLPSGVTDSGVQNDILRVPQAHFSAPRFDRDLGIFSVELDPAVHSFADLRRAIEVLGKRRGLVYLAIVISP